MFFMPAPAHAAVAEAELVHNRGLDERLPLPQFVVASECVLLQGGGVVRQHQARHAVLRGRHVAGPVPHLKKRKFSIAL